MFKIGNSRQAKEAEPIETARRFLTASEKDLKLSDFDAAYRRAQKVSLGGNHEGSRLVFLSGGETVVETYRSAPPGEEAGLLQILGNVLALSNEDQFVPLLWAGLDRSYEGRSKLWIITEDYTSSGSRLSKDGKKILAGGNAGYDLAAARDFPKALRIELREKLLALLPLHPDGHMLNVVWRILENETCQVRLVDPFLAVTSPTTRQSLTRRSPNGSVIDQYLPAVQYSAFSELLNLG